MSILKRILNTGGGEDRAPEELQNLKWGIASPIMLKFSSGIGSVRAFGTFSCRIIDPQTLKGEGCDPGNSDSIAQYRRYITDLVVRSFIDVLSEESASMSLEELEKSVASLSETTRTEADSILSCKGLELSEFKVMQIVRA